jgi:hypothetical protein
MKSWKWFIITIIYATKLKTSGTIKGDLYVNSAPIKMRSYSRAIVSGQRGWWWRIQANMPSIRTRQWITGDSPGHFLFGYVGLRGADGPAQPVHHGGRGARVLGPPAPFRQDLARRPGQLRAGPWTVERERERGERERKRRVRERKRGGGERTGRARGLRRWGDGYRLGPLALSNKNGFSPLPSSGADCSCSNRR